MSNSDCESPLIEVVAAAICHGSRLLALRRSADQPMGGYWELPGGKVEAGESGVECLSRELLEELSIQIEAGEFLGCHNHNYPGKTIQLCVYMVTQWDGDIKLSVHDRKRWLASHQLAQLNWAPADLAHLAAIESRLRPGTGTGP